MSNLRFFVYLAILIAIILFAADPLYNMRTIPQCHEDVVLVGVGDFENGRWSAYACGPAVDDFMP